MVEDVKIMKLHNRKIREIKEIIGYASEIIKDGGLVVYPTDTLYGIGASALNTDAIKKVFEVKKRSFSNPLPIAVSSIEMLREYAFVDDVARKIAEKFLPGALTLILKKKNLNDILTAGLKNVAVRLPANKPALRLIEYAGVPITATSANISGRKPPKDVKGVLSQIKDVDLVLDYGELQSMPSTILDLTRGARIVREGKILREEIERVLREIGVVKDV